MVEGGSLFGAVPIPKRRRTSLKTVPNRAWQYDSQPEESSILSDEAEVAQALQNLASAGPFARAEPEEGDSGQVEGAVYEPEYKRRRDRKGNTQQRSRSRVEVNLDETSNRAQAFRVGQQGASNGVTAHQVERQRQDASGASFGLGQFSSVLPGAPYPGMLPGNPSFTAGHPHLHSAMKVEPESGPKEGFGAQGSKVTPAFKRCASHVYIARFIEFQSNMNRVQQSQQRQANGFGAQHGTDAELPERATAPKAVFNRHHVPTDSAPGNGPGLPTPQPQDPVSTAHPFSGSNHFPTSSGPLVHSAALQELPAFAHLLRQQQGSFPFMPPGVHMGGYTPQQQMAAAQALAGFTGMFPPPHMMFSGALSSQLGTSAANGSTPVPSLPLPMAKAEAKLPQHANGFGMKQDDSIATLLKLGLAPGVGTGVDLERLRAMLPPGFFEQRAAAALNQAPLDGLKPPSPHPDQQALEAWGSGMPTRM